MENLIITQAIVINAERGSITNKAEIEKVVKSLGAKAIFVEYKSPTGLPPIVTAYCIQTTPTITPATRKGK